MTPDKEHAPALMQQAAGEAGDLVGRLRDIWQRNTWDGSSSFGVTVQNVLAEAANTIAILTAQLAAAEAKAEAAYRAGVTAACKEIAPAADMEDHELTQYGRDKRTVADYAYRTLLSPALLASAIRALADQHKSSPAEEPMP